MAVPIAAIALWYLVTAGTYARVEKLFLVLTLVFFAYPAAAVLAHPDWGAVALGSFIPTLHTDPDYLMLLVGLIGSTITPYVQLFQQSAVVEKSVGRDDYGPERVDAFAGAFSAASLQRSSFRDRRNSPRRGRHRYSNSA